MGAAEAPLARRGCERGPRFAAGEQVPTWNDDQWGLDIGSRLFLQAPFWGEVLIPAQAHEPVRSGDKGEAVAPLLGSTAERRDGGLDDLPSSRGKRARKARAWAWTGGPDRTGPVQGGQGPITEQSVKWAPRVWNARSCVATGVGSGAARLAAGGRAEAEKRGR